MAKARGAEARIGRAESDGDPRALPSGREGFDLERFLPYRLSVVTNRISRAFARRYSEEFGLSIPEWRVVAVVGSFQPLSSNEVCRLTEMDKAKVSRAVTRLVAAGLLKRGADKADQRRIRLAFTRKGRQVYLAIVPRARALEAELTAVLEPGEREILERVLTKLYAANSGQEQSHP